MNNDRFKIRYYSKELKRYLTNFEIHSILVMCYVTHNADDNAPEQAVNVSLNECCITEQCTGIKDKNGKLIYELDVVKTVTGLTGAVVWSDYFASFQVSIEGTFGDDFCDVNETQEILCNVHQVEP